MAIDINNFISLKGNINQGVKEALRDLNKNFIVSMIDSDELKPSEDNFYKPHDIDKMKESIEAFGIQQNLIVMKKGDTYEILAGERRYRGNKMLLEEGKEEFRLLPCRILPKVSDTLKNIIIILTNSEARVKSQWEITEEVARLKILYENYKKENPNFKGRVREATAQDLDMSPAQVGRHEKIHKDLIEGLKEEYKDDNINFTVAQAAATLPEEKQEEALQKYQETGTLTTADVNSIKEKNQKSYTEMTPCEQCRASNPQCSDNHCCKTCEEPCNTRQICRIDDPPEKRQAEMDEWNRQTQEQWQAAKENEESAKQEPQPEKQKGKVTEPRLLKIEAAKYAIAILNSFMKKSATEAKYAEENNNETKRALAAAKIEYLGGLLSKVQKDLFDMTGDNMFKE